MGRAGRLLPPGGTRWDQVGLGGTMHTRQKKANPWVGPITTHKPTGGYCWARGMILPCFFAHSTVNGLAARVLHGWSLLSCMHRCCVYWTGRSHS